MRDLRYKLSLLIKQGKVVPCRKIKHHKGLCHLTVGPHQTAVPTDEKFALYINNEQRLFISARGAADAFVDFVGNKSATAAYHSAVNK